VIDWPTSELQPYSVSPDVTWVQSISHWSAACHRIYMSTV